MADRQTLCVPRPKPQTQYPPEIHEAIMREHRSDPMRMAACLQACGWSLAEAAWAAVHWDVSWLAVAIANERAARGAKPTNLSDAELAHLKTEIEEAKRPPVTPKPRKTARIARTTPRLAVRPPRKPEEPKG